MTSCYREIGTVQKSYQYVGHEENAYHKDFDTADVRLCLAFPTPMKSACRTSACKSSITW